MSNHEPWWKAPEGEAHTRVMSYVSAVEEAQIELFDRFQKLTALYNPSHQDPLEQRNKRAQVVENVIAGNVDTVYATTSSTEVKPRILTDDADWSTQRVYKRTERYAEALSKHLKIHDHCARAFKDSALKGTGLVKVWVDDFDEIRVERVMVDDIVVDEGEARNGCPRQMHQRVLVDRETLCAQFSEHEEAIDAVNGSRDTDLGGRFWASYRPVASNEIVVIESWKLPIGVQGKKGYKAGRHTLCIEGATLEDEEWHEAFFPFAVMRWSEDQTGWYGIGLAERIVGHQRTLNKINWQVDRQIDQHAVPTTYVRLGDAGLAVKSVSRAGTVVPYKVDIPKTIIPPSVGAEQFKRRDDIKASSYEEGGVSRATANAMKPSGLASGAALREWKDTTSLRFAPQEKSYEKLELDAIWLALYWAKELNSKAPQIFKKRKFTSKLPDWGKVDMIEVRSWLYASSNISRTPAGRMQLALEWAQAGIISKDDALRLSQYPDTERAMSIYLAAKEDIERSMERCLDGEVVMPEPYQNLKMGIWSFQQEYLRVRAEDAPEEILEILRNWIVQAGHILNPPAPPQPEMGMAPGMEMPMDPAQQSAMPGPEAMMPQGDPGPGLQGAGVTPANLLQ